MTQREEFEKALREMKIDAFHSLELNDNGDGYKNISTTILFAGFRIGLKATKAQAVPCQNVNEAINNPMPRGYMLNTLVKFQKWRIGEDVRTLDETGLTPRLITLAIDWAIEQLDKSKEQTVPQWISVSERLPDEGVLCIVFGVNGVVNNHFEYYKPTHIQSYFDSVIDGCVLELDEVTHWMPLPVAPEQNK